MTEPTADRKTVVFKLDFESPPQFTITYNSKEELFRSFKSKLDEWNIPVEATYFVDLDGDHIGINDADALQGIVMIGADKINVTVRDEADGTGSCPEFGEMIEKLKLKEGCKSLRSRSREHARGCGRSRSGEFSDTEDVRKCCECPTYYDPPFFLRPSYERPPMFCPLNRFYFPIDNGCGCHPSFGMGRGRGKHPRGGMRGRFHCC